MNKQDIIDILLDNGFVEQKWKSLADESVHIEYAPVYTNTEIFFNDNGIYVRSTDDKDFKIRFFNDEMLFLANHQDYWGGWSKQCFKININIIDDIDIWHDMQTINDVSMVQ